MNAELYLFIILFPLIGAALQLFSGYLSPKLRMSIGLIGVLLSSVLTLYLIFSHQNLFFVGQNTFYSFKWMDSFGINLDVGMTGVSVPFLILLSIAPPLIALYYYFNSKLSNGALALFSVIQGSLFGLVFSQNLLFSYFFWIMASLPVYFLLSLWGDKEKEEISFKYITYFLVGNGLLLAALIVLYYISGDLSLSLPVLIENKALFEKNYFVFVLFLLAFALQLPFWPFHRWLLQFSEQSPGYLISILLGIVLPSGFYFFFEVFYYLFLPHVMRFSMFFIVWGAFMAVWSGLSIFSQKDIRGVVSYLYLGQLGLFLIGLGSINGYSINGIIFLSICVAVTMVGFGFFVETYRARFNHTLFKGEGNISLFKPLIHIAPNYVFWVSLLFVSIIAIPGAGEFAGISLLVMGGALAKPTLIFLITPIVALFSFALFVFYRAIFLNGKENGASNIEKIRMSEAGFFVVIIFIIFFLGLYPRVLLDFIKPQVDRTLSMENHLE